MRAALVVTALLAAGAAHAAGIGSGGGPSEVVLVVQIVLLLTVGRLLGEAMLRIGQPAVMGQLLAGILLGPSFLGALWPEAQHWLFPPGRDQKALLDGIAQLGILLLLLMTGMETDLALVRRVRRAALSVSVTGVRTSIPSVSASCWTGEGVSALPRPARRGGWLYAATT